MKQIIRVFGDVKSVSDSADYSMKEKRLFSAVLRRLGTRSRFDPDNVCVMIEPAFEEDIELVQAASEEAETRFLCTAEYNYTPSEVERSRFLALSIEGEPIDMDEDHLPLNEYANTVCGECRMPNELILPNPYRISRAWIKRVEEQNWFGERASSHREIFWGNCGVVIVASRIKTALDGALGGPFVSVPAKLDDSTAGSAGDFWAIRPATTWGVMKARIVRAECPACGRATEARLLSRERCQSVKGRIDLVAHRLPAAEFVCAEGWFGDRRETPFGFRRDIYISGRLYAVLLQTKVRGLITPSEMAWIEGYPSMRGENEIENRDD